jgi:hypothetical protein
VKKVIFAIIVISISLLPACMKNSSNDEAPIALSDDQKELITDAESGFCILDNLTLWDISSGVSKSISGCMIGEKLVLLGQTTQIVQTGAKRDLVHVRQSSGIEGWARAEYVISDSVLAVIVDDEAAVLVNPGPQADTGRLLPRMTIIAIHKDSAATAFLHVSGVEPSSGRLDKSVYLRNSGVSSLIGDVKSAILYQVASRTENPKKRAAFLTSALSDYPRSRFTADIRQALVATQEPLAEEIPTEKFEAVFTTNDDGINVLSVPDETEGSVVAALQKGRTVESVERTTQSYIIGSLSAPWYRIKNPEGWVFGISLSPK